MQIKFDCIIFATAKILLHMVLFLTVWLNFCSIFFVHPVYVSVTNMDVDTQKGSMVVEIRIFADDLETILHNKYNIDGWIGTPAEHRDGRRLLREYVNERFSVTVNDGEKIELVSDSITILEDVEPMMRFYMKGVAMQSIRRIEIDNRLLTDFFSGQNNLVLIGVDRKESGHKLNRKNHKIEISL